MENLVQIQKIQLWLTNKILVYQAMDSLTIRLGLHYVNKFRCYLKHSLRIIFRILSPTLPGILITYDNKIEFKFLFHVHRVLTTLLSGREKCNIRTLAAGQQGDFDSIHNAHIDDYVFVPGCRATAFDCLHMHWRWADMTPTIDPFS